MPVSDLKRKSRRQLLIARILNVIVLICSLVIFMVLSIEILQGPGIIPRKSYLMIQLLICIIFFFDFWFLFFLKERKWHYFITHILFLVVSIPYLNIIDWFGIEVSPFMNILLRSILLIRGGYGMVIMITWFTTSKMTNLLLSYIAILLGSSYFGSLAFFSLEKNVNNGLRDFGDAVWWACMDVTTVGCDIEPVTSEGRILGVILAVMGMSVFPILTAYITTRFQQKMQNKS